MSDIRLGVTLPQFVSDPERLLNAARRAEDAGLHSVWLFDHMWPLSGGKERPILEQWTTLAFVAARTQRIGIGTLVTRSSLRHPAVLAKMAATVATIAPGRLTIGVGSGDELSRAENDAFGLPYWSGSQRIEQLRSETEVVRRFFDGPAVDAESRFGAVRALPPSPRPPVPPRLWLGGNSRAVARLAAGLADGWNAWGLSPHRFARRVALVRSVAPDRRVVPSWAALVQLARTDAEADERAGGKPRDIVGGPAKVARHIAAIAAAGAEEVILTFPDAGTSDAYELLGGEVAERVRGD